MQEYNVIETGSHELFVDTVDSALRNGWKLYGNLIILPLLSSEEKAEVGIYIQAMTREIKEDFIV